MYLKKTSFGQVLDKFWTSFGQVLDNSRQFQTNLDNSPHLHFHKLKFMLVETVLFVPYLCSMNKKIRIFYAQPIDGSAYI